MALVRNNVLFYYGVPLTNLGGSGDKTSVVGVLSKFDTLVVKPHAGADLTALKELLQLYRTVKPASLIYGQVAFTDLTTTQAAVAQWQTDLGAVLSGIYVEALDTATRADQNTLISTIHGGSLSVFVDASNPFPLFETLNGDPDTVLGRSSTITDRLLLNGFYLKDQNVPAPALETSEHMYGRLDYVKNAIVNRGVTPAVNYNIKTVLGISAGTGLAITSADYNVALGIANAYVVDGIAVHNYDKGVGAASYFMKFAANVFVP